MKKLGFTLIELLAVIVILAIIALIATPVILNIIDDARKESFRNSSLSVFKAAELFEAKNDFDKISEDGLNVTDASLPLESGDFKSGKIIRNEENQIELINITDGIYCAQGTKNNLEVIKGSCIQFDKTPPINTTLTIDNITSNSFRVIITSEDLESGIRNYQYSIDGTNFITTTSSNYTFTNLDLNKSYTVYVRVINNNNIETEIVTKVVATKDITAPTYSIDKTGWQTQKIVTINYPTRETGFIYQYSIDAGSTWTTVDSGTTVDVTFNNNGTVIARIYDGTNYKTASSYAVTNIDTTVPTNVTVVVSSKTTNTLTVVGSGLDSESGITKYEFSIDGGSYIDNGNNATYTFTSVTTGNHTLRVRITNGSGLTTESTILTVAPNEITVPTYSIDKTGWQQQKIVTITYPTRQTGFVYQYSINGGSSWTTVSSGTTQTVTFNNNGAVIARIYDGTNYKTASSYTVSQIDTVAPTITFSPNGSVSYVYNNDTDVTFTDNVSGINLSSSRYLWSTSTTTPSESSFTLSAGNGEGIGMINATGAYYLWILIKDNAGNTTIARSNVFNIDVTPPTTPTITGGSTSYATSRTITVSGVTDTGSGINRYEYYLSANATAPTIGTSGTSNGTSTSRVFNTNYAGYYVYFRAIDNVGNVGAWSSAQRLFIDVNNPTISAKGTSYTITQGASNVISSTYFNISQNGNATITNTTCIDTSNSNALVTNTNSLGVGTHVIRCTVTKETGTSANAQTTIVVNPAYTCTTGTLTYDAGRGGYICVTGANSSSSQTCNSWSNPNVFTFIGCYSSDISTSNPSYKIGCSTGTASMCPGQYQCGASPGTCNSYSTSYSYYCPSGWSTYSGSGSSLTCYKAATQG